MSEIVLRKDRHEKNRRILQIIVLAATGILLSVFVAAYATGYWGISEKDGRLNYANEAVIQLYEVDLIEGKGSASNWYEILDDTAIIYLHLLTGREIYNYLKFSVYCETTHENAVATLRFTSDDVVLSEYKIEMDGQYYVYPLPEEEFKYVYIVFENMSNVNVKLENPQYRSNKGLEKLGILWLLFAVALLSYTSLVGIIYFIIKKRGIQLQYYLPLDCMIFLYDRIRRGLVKIRLQEKKGNVLSIVLRGILSISILGYVFYFMYTDSYWRNYDKHVLVIALGILAVSVFLSVLCSGKRYHVYECGRYFCKPAMHNPLALAFFAFSVIAIISELLVNQVMGGFGFFAIGIVGFFGYMAGRKEHRYQFLVYVEAVTVVTFIPCMVKVLFIDVQEMSGRLGGIYENPNQFAIYLILVDVVLLSGLNHCIEQERLSLRLLAESILLGIALFLTWQTQCRSAILACGVVIICIVGKFIITRKRWKSVWKVLLLILLTLKLAVGAWHGSAWAMNSYSLQNGEYKASTGIGGEVIYAAEGKGETVWDRFFAPDAVKNFSSWRVFYYIDYIRNCNLIGHKDFLYIAKVDKVEPSHNAIIGMMYKYGIIAAVPYTVFLILTFVYAVRFWIRGLYKKYNSMLPFGIVVAFLNMSMFDTADERIFWCMLWVLFYLTAGFLMGWEKIIHTKKRCISELIEASKALGVIPDSMKEYMIKTYGRKKTYICALIMGGITVVFSIYSLMRV